MNILSPSQSSLQYLNSITHESKVVVLATDTDGKIYYTIKQDGFEDSYLNTPPDQRTGWENWQVLEFPNEADDRSVIDQEAAELTYQKETSKFILKSRYKTQSESISAPVQVISALGHIYVFRQSKANTLLVDRFVVDGMTNKLNRKLEVRFKRSKQKHTPTKNMGKGSQYLTNVDTLDFRDANGGFFYEPTTEISVVNNLYKGWFSVVLVPTIENDVYRWHIFAYNSNTKKVELTTIRASEEGLFAVKDYTVFEEVNETLVPRKIPGLIRRSLDIDGVTITNGLSATKYDLQQEQETQAGDKQLLKTATRLLLAIPTDKGAAAFSFAIAGDGTLAQIDDTPDSTILRSTQREVLLPLNTLDEIKAFGDKTPPPQGVITGLGAGTDEEEAEDLVKISTDAMAAGLANGDLVKITGNSDYQGLYRTKVVDDNTFEVNVPVANGLGYWERQDEEEGGLVFDGMITAYAKTADGKLRVTCENHGLENGDEVQIVATDSYNDNYSVQKIDNTTFVIDRKWAAGEAINVKLVSEKRRGLVFDGVDDYIEVPYSQQLNPSQFTIECWVKFDGEKGKSYSVLSTYRAASGREGESGYRTGYSIYISENKWGLERGTKERKSIITTNQEVVLKTWTHIAATYSNNTFKFYINGIIAITETGYVPNPNWPLRIGADTKTMAAGTGVVGDPRAFFSGQIAEVRLWKVEKSAQEIKNNIHLRLTGKEIGLVGYWRLGGISEGKVIDFSGNGNDGIVYSDPYVSAATLSRKLEVKANAAKTDVVKIDAVKYSNPELFAVSERATYEESFEFKVNSSTSVNLAYLDNADGAVKIFTLSYWGKTSRSAEEKKPISAVQGKFEEVGNGWYRVSCNVTIPDEISMLRSFEITNVKGNWDSLEIRKHRIRLLSDSITEAKYIDTVTLATLADNQVELATKLKKLELKEQQEISLLKEKRELEVKIAAYNAQDATRKRIAELEPQVRSLEIEEKALLSKYNAAQNSPFNYLCYLDIKVGNSWKNLHVSKQSDGDNTALVRYSGNGNLVRFNVVDANKRIYDVSIQVENSWKGLHVYQQSDDNATTLVRHNSNGNLVRFKGVSPDNGGIAIDGGRFGFLSADGTYITDYNGNYLCDYNGEYYYIDIKVGSSWKGLHVYQQSNDDEIKLIRHNGDGNLVRMIKTNQTSNDSIDRARQAWQEKLQQLTQAKNELSVLRATSSATPADKAAWDARLAQLIKEITQIQTELNTLNTDFLNGVKSTQVKAQTMPQVGKDGKGLVTQGALLGFVQSASRLSAIETCEGNVQLSYFDNQGQMRQTNYDATADSKNTAFEQWIPDAQRACLNFSNNNSVVKLKQPLYLLGDWSIETWFVYPLPQKTDEWTCFTRGDNYNTQIIVKNGKQLGTFLGTAIANQNFYDSGFNLELLSPGWHHLTAVGRGDTTLFYIDGKKVGDTKAKALTDAQENLKKNPNDAATKQRVEDLKKASLKVVNKIETIGNADSGGKQAGKLAEVRVWNIALSEEEIAVNSKTLLSGNEPGLLAYYPFKEATDEIVRDQTCNGFDGKVSGANWWGCSAPIGNPDNTVMKFDGVNDYIEVPSHTNPTDAITISLWAKSNTPTWNNAGVLISKRDAYILHPELGEKKITFYLFASGSWRSVQLTPPIDITQWHHYAATFDGKVMYLYIDGEYVAEANFTGKINADTGVMCIGKDDNNLERYFNGQIADVQIWKVARTKAEIKAGMSQRLTGKESNLVAYYPLNEIKLEGSVQKVLDLAGNNHGIVKEAITVETNTLPLGSDALISGEYSSVTIDSSTRQKVAMMRRFFAYPNANGAALLPDKRIESLELKWIGNAQFAPTLLGYIEGAPPVPSENLTIEEDYNGATSVELTMSEDVEFSWNRSQDTGLGASVEAFIGAGGTMSILTAPMGVGSSIDTSTKVGFQGNFDFNYQFQNESSITSSSSLSMTDKLELRGTPEETPKFPHLGTRFIPKNIGYALVISATADVFVTRLARSGKMVGYQVQPVEGIPPDVNTITFLMNPAYTMNGSLDGLTGSSATSDRFFKHVPEMRSQYGSLYPASYYRLREAYDLKQAIEAEDKRRESYFSNFNVRLVDETSLNRNIDSGDAPTTIGVQREEDKPGTQMTAEEKAKAQDEKANQFQADGTAAAEKTSDASKAKQAEIQSKISDQDKRVQATSSFDGWQKRMEDIQIRAGKRNIVNTYVWDADGGLRTEAQSFASTVEHSIGGSFSMNAGLGVASEFAVFGIDVELKAQATVNLTQTMSKTEARSKGFELNVDLSGLEYKGITNYDDKPVLPGEKVDRYRFMSFYLEGSTNNFQDFFSYVVDPEWLRSNDEEARALRQTQAGKPNKAWRVLHRVTYVERPALMGFGRDVRKLRAAAESSDQQQLLDKIAKLEESNKQLEAKLDKVLDALKKSTK